MTFHSVLTAATHAAPVALTTAQLALTAGAGAVAVRLLHLRGRGPGPATPSPREPRAGRPTPAAPTPLTLPAITCRPQRMTPPGTARARGEVEQWLARGELDPETYSDLRRVFAEVEAATRG